MTRARARAIRPARCASRSTGRAARRAARARSSRRPRRRRRSPRTSARRTTLLSGAASVSNSADIVDAEHLADAVQRADGRRRLAALDGAHEGLGEARGAGDVVERRACRPTCLAQATANELGRPAVALVGRRSLSFGVLGRHRLCTVAELHSRRQRRPLCRQCPVLLDFCPLLMDSGTVTSSMLGWPDDDPREALHDALQTPHDRPRRARAATRSMRRPLRCSRHRRGSAAREGADPAWQAGARVDGTSVRLPRGDDRRGSGAGASQRDPDVSRRGEVVAA